MRDIYNYLTELSLIPDFEFKDNFHDSLLSDSEKSFFKHATL
jgi:hypothetical protein